MFCASAPPTRNSPSSDQVTVVVGNSLVASNWITQDLGPSSSRRGQGLEYGGLFSVTGTGAGYNATSSDQAHIMVRSAVGDGSVVARLTSFSTTGPRRRHHS
jgi:hypothetical protein